MTDTPRTIEELARLADLPPDHRLVRIAVAEHDRLMRKLGGEASEREQWLVMLCVQRAMEIAALQHKIRVGE